MNAPNSKEQELLLILDNIEASYNSASPQYKFNHVFYNIVDYPFQRPYDFPIEIWNAYITEDKSLMPVILNKQQIDERKVLQNELIVNINESKNGLLKKIDNLKVKKETIKNRLETLVCKYRRVSKQYLVGEPIEDVYKIYIESLEREKLFVGNSKEELLSYLSEMNKRLVELEKRVSEFLYSYEKKRISGVQK